MLINAALEGVDGLALRFAFDDDQGKGRKLQNGAEQCSQSWPI